ncbi:hypothetical protein C1645_836045 [Glomus cerebriforme]|uniref:MULE transposase domain-containing protein n=1 Tax=Glomus cerebriforme TaxID=658196 RepID=A0A397SCH2_9GLOM|nr:hypothetical protein C1645_836045 [Glomus cerebriforme]
MENFIENDADNDQIIVEFHDFYDFFAHNYNLFECAIHDKDEQENSENLEFKVSCIVDVDTLKEISRIKLVDCLGEKQKKNPDINKHRDRQSMRHFSCNGCVKITIYENSTLSKIETKHILHSIRPDTSISQNIKTFILENTDLLPREIYKRLVERGLNTNIRQKQIHFWWVELESPKAFGFLTKLWNILQNSHFSIDEIGIDATYNTNNLKFELYVIQAEIDGVGFPMAYLFLENNGNCGNGVRTGVIIDFLAQLKICELEPNFLITDKDFAQISAACFV